MNVIHNAVSDCGPPRKQEVRSLRSQLHVGEDDLLIGVVSRLEVPRKGHHVLFQALSSLPPVDAGVRCVVVGDGPGKGELLRHAASLGLESKVSFVGEQHNVPVWLDAMDIFVLPSLLEGSPIAIIEAMARALPIVATRTGGITEMIRDGTDGMLAEPGSWESLAQAMERLIRDAGLRSRLGSAARTRFESGFEIGAAVRATERLYTRLTRGTDSRRRIRLFEVVTNFEPGGVPRHMTDLIDGLDRDIFETRMVSGETLPERIPQNNVPHYRVPMVKRIDPVQDARSIRALVKLFRKEKPDMVHAHMSKANFLASIAARLSGVPVMLNTIHGQTTLERGWSLKQTVFDWCEWLALRFCTDMTISVSHAATRHLLTSHKVQRRRVITIHNGIDAQPVDEWVRETTRRALGLTGTHTVVLMTGRFAEPKRQETLVEACALLKFRYPGLVCLLAGDGPKRLELESLADRLGCASCVRILGHRADVPALLSAADVFALCSWQEGLSIAVLEAMAQGLPVIASRILGMDEPVVHGVTGYLVTEGSAEACAAALEIFLKDPGKRKKFGDAGRQRWMQYFGLSRQVAQTQQVLLACAKEKVRV
jgi:glycosyltransferase involved in cell wall biosynthesis